MTKRFLLLLLGISLTIAACTAAPSPNSTAPIAEVSTEEIVAEEEATQEDTPITRGESLFNETRGGFACATCHYNTTGRLLGPGLANSAERIEAYGLEESVEDYLRSSILEPTAFIAPAEPAYPANIMPMTYRSLFTDEEISELIAYILSL